MTRLHTCCAYLLAIPLIGSGACVLFDLAPTPTETGFAGEQVLALGIVSFNPTLFPPGVPLAIAMLALILGVVLDPARVRSLLSQDVAVPEREALSLSKQHVTEQAR